MSKTNGQSCFLGLSYFTQACEKNDATPTTQEEF